MRLGWGVTFCMADHKTGQVSALQPVLSHPTDDASIGCTTDTDKTFSSPRQCNSRSDENPQAGAGEGSVRLSDGGKGGQK